MSTTIIEIPKTAYKFILQDPEALRIFGSNAHHLFMVAQSAVNVMAEAKANTEGDAELSWHGRQNRLAPIFEIGWAALCAAYVGLAGLVRAVDEREARLFALPKLDSTATAVAIEDREVRDWWRAQPLAARAAIMEAMESDPKAGAKYARLQLALLRSPIPLPDVDADFMARLWKQTQRLGNVGEALAIDTERNAIEWAASALGHLYGIVKLLSGWNDGQIAAFIVADDKRVVGASGMGFSDQDIAEAYARREAVHKTRRAA